MATISAGGMVATSHPVATRYGVRALESGGTAVDAALAAAAVLPVCEPGHNGIGGDAFALLWWDGEVCGLNGSGRAPFHLGDEGASRVGPRSVTVPGAVRAWADLAARFGRFGFDTPLGAAADLASEGVCATPRVAEQWQLAGDHAPWPAPSIGERYVLPGLATTLADIASSGPDAFYVGPTARAIAKACWLSEEDLAAHESEWVTPISRQYRGVDVYELPPNAQGAAVLAALGVLEGLEPTLHNVIEATKVALDWAAESISDSSAVEPDIELLRERVGEQARIDTEVWASSNTTYLCAVDVDRNAVSLIQSIFVPFGSGVVAGDTGVLLQNRAAGFRSEPGHRNSLAPGRRPFHTIIPGMLAASGSLLGPFGVTGGPMQAQGQVQVLRGVIDGGLDPQAALDAPRFRVAGGPTVFIEPGLNREAAELRALGHDVIVADDPHSFGVGQMILTCGDGLIGGSDGRADGHAGAA